MPRRPAGILPQTLSRELPASWREPSPDGEGLEVGDFPGVLLVGTSALLQRHVTRPALEPHGLGVPEWRLLAFLAANGRSTSADMTSQMWMDKAQISRVAEALITRGFARRKADPAHRQRQWVELTARGRRVYGEAFASTRRHQAELLLALSLDEREGLFKALLKLRGLAEGAASASIGPSEPEREGGVEGEVARAAVTAPSVKKRPVKRATKTKANAAAKSTGTRRSASQD